MTETRDELNRLKQKLLGVFREEASEWNSRKHDAPSPNDEDDYWWECKAKWSMCLDAVRIVEKSETSGTREEYVAHLQKAFAENRWGFMENWGSGPEREGEALVFDRLNGALADAAKLANVIKPEQLATQQVSSGGKDDIAQREKKLQTMRDMIVKKRKEAKESGELDRLGLG
jgi:hypothetical protein